MNTVSNVRAPAVAGLFYPRDAGALAAQVDALLASVPAPADNARVHMLLSPHAGYAYSGRVAASGFRLLSSPRVSAPATAIVIGPSHVEVFSFTSIFDGGAYRTPLGDLPVDASLARRLAGAHPSIRLSSHGHVQARGRGEHGIEVLLPFLQRALGNVSIVPIVMGSQAWAECAALGSAIAACSDAASTIVIASSDLSHFYDYHRANELDAAFCAALVTMDARALHASVARGECEACGAGPVVAALLATEGERDRRCRLLTRINSGDVTGDRSSVVGYASAVVTSGGS